jgi:hypothetical protein
MGYKQEKAYIEAEKEQEYNKLKKEIFSTEIIINMKPFNRTLFVRDIKNFLNNNANSYLSVSNIATAVQLGAITTNLLLNELYENCEVSSIEQDEETKFGIILNQL